MKFFYEDIEIEVPGDVYYPREDSELLANEIAGMDLKGKNALEVGCGSGLLSIVMVKKGAIVTAADVNHNAIKATEINAAKNGVSIKIVLSDLFAKVNGQFDIIIFNPPYLPDDILREDNIERQWSGGPAGRAVIEKFIKNAKKYLAPGGKIIICISSLTDEKEVTKMFHNAGMTSNVIARQKIPWEELIVIVAE